MTKDAGGVTLSETQIGDKAPCPLLNNIDRSHTDLATILDVMQTDIDPFDTNTTSGTLYSKLEIVPGASETIDSITRHTLVAIGDKTGTTAYGFGAPTVETRGVMMSFGRTTIASGDFADEALDVRAINKLVNTGAYNLKGAMIKAKNYSGGTVQNLVGVFIETVDDGTTTLSTALEIGADSSTVNEGIVLDNGTFTVGIDLTDSCTTGIDIGAATTGITFSGDQTTCINVAAGCTPTDAILIAGAAADGIEISSACTTKGIHISGDCKIGVSIASQTTSAIAFEVSAGSIVDAASSVTIYGGNTGGDNLVLRGNSSDTTVLTVDGATGLTLAGTVTTGLDISTASTAGISINTGTPTDGIKISANCADGIEISGTCTVKGVHVSGDCKYGISIASQTTAAVGFEVSGGTIIDAASSVTIYGGNTGGDNLVLRSNSSDTTVLTVDGATGLTLAGTVTTGLDISTASTAGISINTSAPTDGIKISSNCADGIELSGINTANGLNISGAQTIGNGIAITSTGTLTGTLKGIAIDYDAIVLGTYNNTGIEVLMHATYGGTGTEYAGYFSGDGTTVALCSDAAAAITIGGTVTTGLTVGAATTAISIGDSPTGISFTNVGAATEHLIDVVNAYTGLIIETGSYSDASGNAVTLNSTNARPVSFLFDDGDVAMTGNVRGVLSRVAVVADHTGALTLEAVRGQCKITDAVGNFDGDYMAGISGYIEIEDAVSMTLNSAGHAVTAVRARVEVGGNVTIDTDGAYLCGVFAELNTTGAYTITQTDAILAGYVVEYTDQKNDKWGHGLYIADGATDIGVTIGTCTTGVAITSATGYAIDIAPLTGQSGLFRMGTQDYPVPLTTTYPYGMDIQVEALSDIEANDTGVTCGIHSRYEVDFDQVAALGFVAVEGQLRIKKAMVDGSHAAIRGYVEVDGSPALGSASTTSLAAGHFSFALAAGTTLTDDLNLNAVIIDADVESAISVASAKFVGLWMKKTSGSLNFETGIHIDDCADIGIAIGACTTGINLEGTIDLALGIGSTTPLTTATTGKKAALIQSNFSGNGYHFGAQVISQYTLDDASYGSVRAIVGQVDLSATQTTVGSAQYLVGVHGRAMVSGTAYNSALMVTGVMGQILNGGTYTAANHVSAGWFDWQLNTPLSGVSSSEILYLSNNADNSTNNPDHMMYLYAPYVTNFFSMDGAGNGGMVSATYSTPVHAGTCKKIKVDLDGDTYYMLVSTAPTD